MAASITLRKFHISGFIRYLLLLLVDILALWYFHGYLFLLILCMLIPALPASVLLTFWGLRNLDISLTPDYARLPYQTPDRIQIHLKNNTFFPLFHLNMELLENNLFLKEQRMFTCRHYRRSALFRKGKKHIKKSTDTSSFRRRSVLVFPKETAMIPHTVLKDNCGNICFTLQNIQLTDYFGIFTFGRTDTHTASVVYLPQKSYNSEDSRIAFQKMQDLQKEIQQKGFDDPEPLQIREYIPGDKLNHIHWKLSSKCEQLMVKDFEKEEGGRIFLAVELYYSPEDSAADINSVLDRTYETALYFLQLHYRVNIGWWSVGANAFLHKEAATDDMLEDIFLEIVQEQTYTSRDLLEDYLGSDSPYIKMVNT